MGLSSFFPENVEQNPSRFLGPQVLSVFVEGIELGIIVNLAVRFWSRSDREPVVMRMIVVLVLFLTLWVNVV